MNDEARLRAGDAAARDLAQREFAQPLVLRAGAGTGKTAALTARIVAWMLGDGWSRACARAEASEAEVDAARERADAVARDVLARVVAITFTEAAAAEMSERIEEGLRAIECGELAAGFEESALPGPGARALRARALREALDHLSVSTIHAFCRSLLARFPIAARLRPDFEVDATGRAQFEAMQRALERALRRDYAAGGPLLDLASAEVGPARALDAALELAGRGVRAADLARDPLPRSFVASTLGVLRDAAARVAACRPDEPPQAPAARVPLEVMECAQRAASALADVDLEREDDALLDARWREAARAFGARKTSVVSYAAKGLPRNAHKHFPLRAEAEAALQALAGPLSIAASVDPARLRAAFASFRELLGESEAALADAGIQTFDDLLRRARDLLVDHPDVARLLRSEIEQLLVDEFQDTDALQCDIVRALALPEGEDDAEPRPGLFLVGDPKQSIYGFRGADLAAYDAFVADVERAGGRVLDLCVNFRSLPAVLAEVERRMSSQMSEEEGVQAAFQPLFAGGQIERTTHLAAVEHWVSWAAPGDPGEKSGSETPKPVATRIEARAFARDVRRLRDEHGVALEKVALLLRAASDVDVYLRALRDEGVPYVAHRGTEYAQRREVIDAGAALRCVLDPHDQIALVAFLRSACVGVPDAALLALWTRGFPQRAAELYGEDERAASMLGSLVREAAASLDRDSVPGLDAIAGWEESAIAALLAVGRLRASFESDAPDRFVERMRAELALELAEAARFPGALRIANLDRFYRELADDLAAGADAQALLRRLRAADARSRAASEPVAIAPGAVQVLTIHGAKGLGFAHVYLAQAHKGSNRGRRRDAEVERAQGELEIALVGTQTPGFERAREARARREQAEQVRALYVAMTRAKERLVVMGSRPPHKRIGELRGGEGKVGSFADILALCEGEPDLEQAFADGRARFEHDGVVWRFPALEADAEHALARAPIALEWPTARDLEQTRESLEQKRGEARARMQGRRTGTVAGDAKARERELQHEQLDAAVGPEPSHAAVARARPSAAAAIGTALHALLEDWDFAADRALELARQRERVPALLAVAANGEAPSDELVAGARDVLDAFARTPLFERFAALGDAVLARELPILLPPRAGALDGVDGVVGAVDLVVREPDGQLTVVDYKTDAVADGAAARARAAAYVEQGRAYVRALRDGLALASEPRFELWFVRSGDVVRPLEVPDAGVSAP